MRLKEEAAVLTRPSPVARPIGHVNSGGLGLLRSPLTDSATDQTHNNTGALNGMQWLTNYEADTTTTDNNVVSNCPERHQQYITSSGTLDNAHSGIAADGNSNHQSGNSANQGVVITPLASNQVEETLRASRRRLVSRDEVTTQSVVLVPLSCSPDDGILLNTGEDVQMVNNTLNEEDDDEEEDSSEDSSSSATSTCSASSSTSSSDSALIIVSEGGHHQHQRRQRRTLRRPRAGILNPNYPGFQRYANRLHLATHEYEEEEEEGEGEEEDEEHKVVTRNINSTQTDMANNNNNNNPTGQVLNQLDGVVKRFDKSLSCEGVAALNIPPMGGGVGEGDGTTGREGCCCCPEDAKERNNVDSRWSKTSSSQSKMEDAHLSGTGDKMTIVAENIGREGEEGESGTGSERCIVVQQVTGGLCKKDKTEVNRGIRMAQVVAPDATVATSQKVLTPMWAQQMALRREQHDGCINKNPENSRRLESDRDKPRRNSPPGACGGFDVYNIETAMPSIDLDAIESHLRAAEERRRRNDREEIRRRLAMGPEADDCYAPGRKPSLQSRLQSGMNLQICFMNETLSDGESPSGSDDSPTSPPLSSSLPSLPHHPPPPSQTYPPLSTDPSSSPAQVMPNTLSHTPPRNSLSLKSSMLSSRGAPTSHSLPVGGVVGRWDVLRSSGSEDQPLMVKWEGEDFFGRQARLQAEARVALAQAKEMAHMQMEVERQRLKANSPITQMVRASLLKVGMVFPVDRRRVSRQMLTEMNVAQLQVIVNDLHTQIEVLNEDLVKLLMERDDLHMEQDSMLVDIEDLTRYLGAKEKALKESGRDPGGCGSNRGGEAGTIGSLPSLPLIFRHTGGHNKLNQSNRPRIGLLSKK